MYVVSMTRWRHTVHTLVSGVQAQLSIATIPRAHLIIISPPPVKTSQTEYSRWGSPALARFVWRAVTRRSLDAQPAPTQLTSDVLNPSNACIPVYNVMDFLSVIWGKMRFLMIARKNIKTMMQRLAGTKYPHMPPFDAIGHSFQL